MKSNIELLLVENVDNLGIVGDIVKIKPGYARNFLVPHGLAQPPTEGARKRVAARRQEVQEQLRQLTEQRRAMVDRLDDRGQLTLERAANEQGALYGSVSQHDIAQALRDEGFEVEDRFIRIGEQIKRLDAYDVPIVIDKDLQTQIKLWVVSDQPMPTEPQEDAEAEGEMEMVPADTAEAQDAGPAEEMESSGGYSRVRRS